MVLIDPKNKERYIVSFEQDQYPSQCGVQILSCLKISNNKKYLKNYPEEYPRAFELLKRYLFDNEVQLCEGSYMSPFYNDDYEDKPICALVLLSDVVADATAPYMTGAFAQYLKIPNAGVVNNPNSRNNINLWWYNMPLQDYYEERQGYDSDND
jgi:hypothetical protein